MRTIKRDVVGAFIFSNDSKLLVGKSIKGGVYQDAWIIPGGGIEDGETHREALSREVKEETGIDIANADVKLIEGGAVSGVSEKTLRETNERVLVNMTFYNFFVQLQVSAEDAQLQHEDDFIDSRWVSREELSGLTLSPPTVATLRTLGYIN